MRQQNRHAFQAVGLEFETHCPTAREIQQLVVRHFEVAVAGEPRTLACDLDLAADLRFGNDVIERNLLKLVVGPLQGHVATVVTSGRPD